MTSVVMAVFMLASSANGTVAAPQKPMTRPSIEAPPIAGVKAPPGTTLVNMDIIVTPRPRGEPAIYELANTQNATNFRDQYAQNARRAGYRILVNNLTVVGVKTDGTVIRLRVIGARHGCSGILTVKPPKNHRA